MGAHRRLPLLTDRGAVRPAGRLSEGPRGRPIPRPRPAGETRYRFRFEKTGPTALLGHLDLIRALPRVFRRVGIPLSYSQGFHPKPDMGFSPALSLGVVSLGEYVDMKLLAEIEPTELLEAMNLAAPEGLIFTAGIRLGPQDPGITKIITGARYLIAIARVALADHGGEAWLSQRIAATMELTELKLRREIGDLAKYVDVRAYLGRAALGDDAARALVARAGILGDLIVVDTEAKITGSGAVKTVEIVEAITGEKNFPHRAVRAALFGEPHGGHGGSDGPGEATPSAPEHEPGHRCVEQPGGGCVLEEGHRRLGTQLRGALCEGLVERGEAGGGHATRQVERIGEVHSGGVKAQCTRHPRCVLQCDGRNCHQSFERPRMTVGRRS